MTNIDAKTPQLAVIKRLFDAYCTRDTRNVLPLLAKDFKAQSFPKRPELPDEAREEHVKKWGGIQSLLSKIEVRTWASGNLLPARNLISPTPRSSLTK